jgi:hypothetical protein
MLISGEGIKRPGDLALVTDRDLEPHMCCVGARSGQGVLLNLLFFLEIQYKHKHRYLYIYMSTHSYKHIFMSTFKKLKQPNIKIRSSSRCELTGVASRAIREERKRYALPVSLKKKVIWTGI